jgi:hypothetical protein
MVKTKTFRILLLLVAALLLSSCQTKPVKIILASTATSADAGSVEEATLSPIIQEEKPTEFPQETQTHQPLEPTPFVPVVTSVLSEEQLERLEKAAANYISLDSESANLTVKQMNYAAGADASLTCGPLAIAILQDAGLVSPYLPLNAFWLSSPRPDKNEPIFLEAFPQDKYEWKRDYTPMAEMDYLTDPLLPGDFIYTFGGNYEHMFTVTRMDEMGRVYTVQNLEQGYLNDDPDDLSFVIAETLLYDPNQPGIGMVYEWTDDFNWKLGHTGTEGYMRFRPIVAIEDPSEEEMELANQIDAIIETTGGKWNILIETLDGEEIYARRPDERIHPASTIKVAISMMTFEFLNQYGQGTLEENLQRGPIYNIMENDRSYEQLLRNMLVLSEEDAADILYENIHESPLNEFDLLAEWGLENTVLEPRKSTVREINAIYRALYNGTAVTGEERQLILDWLAAYTENDDLRLGRMNELSKETIFPYNKRGSLFAPLLIVADSGIAIIADQVYLLEFYAYHDPVNPATYEELEAALGELGLIVGSWLLDQNASTP